MERTENLEPLEEAMREIQARQEDFRALEPLLGNIDSLLRFDANSAAYRRKLADLSQKSAAVQKCALSLQAKVDLYSNSADESVRELARRRERDAKSLESKLAAIEATYKSLKGEGNALAKKLTAELEAERATFQAKFDQKLKMETEIVREQLENEKQKVRSDAEVIKRIVKEATKVNSAYAKKNSDLLKSALPKASRTEEVVEAGKKTALEEVKTKVGSSATDVKNEVTKQTQAAVEKFMKMVSEVVEGVREMKTNLHLPEAGQSLSRYFANIRALLDDLSPYLTLQIRNLASSQSLLEARLKKTKAATLTEEVKALLSDAEKSLAAHSDSLTFIETRLQVSISGLESAFSQPPAGQIPAEKRELIDKFRREFGMKRPMVEKGVQSLRKKLQTLQSLCTKLRSLPVEEPKPQEEAKVPADDSKVSDQSSAKA